MKGSCHCQSTGWTFDGDPGDATACNCTLCRRYGTLWAYDWVDGKITILGTPGSYRRADMDQPEIEFLFCQTCGCVISWRALDPDGNGRRRIAVNLRLAEPGEVANLPIRLFDGLDKFEDTPSDGRCVRDMWY